MLGPTDPSHIVRTIEYWDIERRRYPAYDHVAVLIAEDVTARYLNLLALFADSIPLIVIQLNCLKVANTVVLDLVQVLNQTSLRRDDETPSRARGSTRAEWEKYCGSSILGLVDQMLEMINEKAQTRQQLNYLQQYIGMSDGVRSRNFVYFVPRKNFTYLYVTVPVDDSWNDKLEEVGLPAVVDGSNLGVTIEPSVFSSGAEVLRALLHAAVESFES